MNGRRGRARALSRIRKRRLAEAVAAGVDPTDRKAVDEHTQKTLLEMYERIRERRQVPDAEA